MNKIVLLFVAAAACSVAATAAEHFLPEQPWISNEERIDFVMAYRADVQVRMRTHDGRRPIYTGIRFEQFTGTFHVFSLNAGEDISRASDIYPRWAATHCDRPMDTLLARRIIRLWKAAMREARPDTPEENEIIGVDGTDYYFWSNAGFYAKTWSPESKSTPRLLVDLAFRLGETCTKPDENTLALLRASADELSESLKAS